MLTDEQRRALTARLASPAQEPEQIDTPEPTHQPAEQATVEAKGEGEDDSHQAQSPATPERSQDNPKTVPLDEHVKLRQDRKLLRQQLEETRERLAKLEGFVAGQKNKSPTKKGGGDWLDELLAETTEDEADNEAPDPRDQKLQYLESVVGQIQAERGKAILEHTIKECRAVDPTVPRDFLVEAFSSGRTPDQALARWAEYKKAIGGVPPVAQETTKVVAPPVVPKAPSAKSSNQKPASWDEVAKAVRRAMSR